MAGFEVIIYGRFWVIAEGQTNSAFRCLWPDEATLLQTLRKQAQAIAIEPEALHDVTSAPPKQKHMSREWLLLQNGLNLGAQPIEATAHIGYAGSEPDPGSCGKMDHLRKLSRTQRTTAGSAPFSTLIIARPGSSI